VEVHGTVGVGLGSAGGKSENGGERWVNTVVEIETGIAVATAGAREVREVRLRKSASASVAHNKGAVAG